MLWRVVVLQLLLAISLGSVPVIPFDLPPATTGVLVFWRSGGVCSLPRGAGPREYPSTPPTGGVQEGDGYKKVWYRAVKRFKRVKVHGQDPSERRYLLVARAEGGGGVEV